jgi:hypothetical protein
MFQIAAHEERMEGAMPICYDDDSFYDFLSTGDGSHVSRKILMEGDSWISHPQVHNRSRAMDYDGEGDYGILNLGNPGATAHEMFHKASGSLRRLHRVVKTLLTRFRDAMQQLENEFPRFLLVDTLRTLSTSGKPDVSLFHDEIHPNLRGFRKVFRRIKRVARARNMWL